MNTEVLENTQFYILKEINALVDKIGQVNAILSIAAGVIAFQFVLWALTRINFWITRMLMNYTLADYDTLKVEFFDNINEPKNLSRRNLVLLQIASQICFFVAIVLMAEKIHYHFPENTEYYASFGVLGDYYIFRSYFGTLAMLWALIFISRKGVFIISYIGALSNLGIIASIVYACGLFVYLSIFYEDYKLPVSLIALGLLPILIIILILLNARFMRKTNNIWQFHMNLFLISIIPFLLLLPIIHAFDILDYISILCLVFIMFANTMMLYYFRYLKDQNVHECVSKKTHDELKNDLA